MGNEEDERKSAEGWADADRMKSRIGPRSKTGPGIDSWRGCVQMKRKLADRSERGR